MIICRSSSWIGSPWACSGQNQAFTKELYNRVGGFNKIKSFCLEFAKLQNEKQGVLKALKSAEERVEKHKREIQGLTFFEANLQCIYTLRRKKDVQRREKTAPGGIELPCC